MNRLSITYQVCIKADKKLNMTYFYLSLIWNVNHLFRLLQLQRQLLKNIISLLFWTTLNRKIYNTYQLPAS